MGQGCVILRRLKGKAKTDPLPMQRHSAICLNLSPLTRRRHLIRCAASSPSCCSVAMALVTN